MTLVSAFNIQYPTTLGISANRTVQTMADAGEPTDVTRTVRAYMFCPSIAYGD